MAIKRTLTQAVPYSESGKVTRWELEMKYEQGTEGKDDYYTTVKRQLIEATNTNPVDGSTTTNFTAKAEKDWTKKELEDLCPIAHWDLIFASQYDSVITNPKTSPVPNNEYAIPSS